MVLHVTVTTKKLALNKLLQRICPSFIYEHTRYTSLFEFRIDMMKFKNRGISTIIF